MVDDKKRCKEKRNNYDKIKLPLLVSAIVGLVLLLNNDSFTNIFIASDYNKHSMLERPIEISIERIIERPIELPIERPMEFLNRHNNLVYFLKYQLFFLFHQIDKNLYLSKHLTDKSQS